MNLALAVLPILITIGLLITKLPAWVPPAAGTLTALLVAVYGLDAQAADLSAAWVDVQWTLVKVLAIIGGGVTLSMVMTKTGAQDKLAAYLGSSGPSVPTALMMVTGVVPFMETVTGFGVAVLIGMPLLMSVGFPAIYAALLALLGLHIGAWGSMAPGTLLGSQIAGVSLTDLGIASGVMNLPILVISGVTSAVIAGRYVTGRKGQKWPGAREVLVWATMGAASALILGGLVILVNSALGTPVAGAVSTAVMTVGWLTIIRRGKLTPAPIRSLIPYAVLVLGTITGQLLSRVIPVVWLSEVLSSPALWSFAGVGVGLLILPLDSASRAGLPLEAFAMWVRTALPTAFYILLGVMIGGGGLSAVMADSLTAMGPIYLFFAPFVGGVGGYITASGTGGNAMFGPTQVAAAQTLSVSPLWMMATHNVAVCWAVIASPARVELAYQLGRGQAASEEFSQDDEQPETGSVATRREFSRAAMLRVTVPILAVSLLVLGLMNMFVVPYFA